MNAVERIKMANDQDLFVRELPKWQEQRRQREARRYPDNLIYFRRPHPQVQPDRRTMRDRSMADHGGLAILGVALVVLVVCAILAV